MLASDAIKKRKTIVTAMMIAAALSIVTALAPAGQAFADDNNGLVVPHV